MKLYEGVDSEKANAGFIADALLSLLPKLNVADGAVGCFKTLKNNKLISWERSTWFFFYLPVLNYLKEYSWNSAVIPSWVYWL